LIKASGIARVCALHDEVVELVAKHATDQVSICVVHQESPSLTARYDGTIHMRAINQVVNAAAHDAAFQADAFQANAFQKVQRIIAEMTAKIDTETRF